MLHLEERKPLSTTERIAAMSRVGAALMSELDEDRLLHLIAEAACELTGATFAAFSLRPMNDEGEPLVPSEGNLFHLAAVVGVTEEQAALFRRMPLGGEGLLAPIFRQGVPVRVADALTYIHRPEKSSTSHARDGQEAARQAAFAFAHGQLPAEGLHSMGVPRGHPIVRSFLGAPVLDRHEQVRGGLLLGHGNPDQFTHEDEVLLVGLAAQAAVALENARLYRAAGMRAQELHAIFETIADGVTLVDHEGNLLRENGAARRLRERLKSTHEGEQIIEALLHAPARRALDGEAVEGITVRVTDGSNERREYLVTASPLHLDTRPSSPLLQQQERRSTVRNGVSGVVVVWQDVTERLLRESERQARSQAKQLEAIFEAMTDGVFVYDSNGTIVQMNTTARTLFALDSEPEYASRPLEERLARLVVHDTQGQLFPRELFPQVRLLKGEVLGGVNAVDVLVQALDGREFQASIGGAPLYDQEGRIIGAVMTVRDMSERYRLERRLYEAEREARERATKLEAIFEAMVDAVYVYDGEGRIVQMNAVARELAVRSNPLDALSRPLRERTPQTDVYNEQGQILPRERWPITRILLGEVLTLARAVDVLFPAFDGRDMYMSVTGGPMYDPGGAIIGAVAIARDVTERRRLEQIERQMRAETEARLALLQLILDELPSSVYLVRGRDARLVLANCAAATVWGAAWPVGQPLSAFFKENGIRIFGVDGQLLAPEQLATLRAVQHGERVGQQQEIIRHPDGTTLPTLVSAVALDGHQLGVPPWDGTFHFTDGPEPAALVVHQDVTALKEAEYLKDEFISIAAHELRTPVAVLKGFAQTLLLQTRRGKGAALAEWQLEALEEIDQATRRLVELSEDLLDVTRLQAGRLTLHREPTDLVTLVQRVVTRLRMTAERHLLSIDTTRAHLVLSLDSQRIEQVLSNLIGNAIKYSPDEGAIEIMLREEGEAKRVVLSVRDHGIGIPTQQQASIFGRFMRADNARAYGIGGTGLGLYLSRELVELHGGRIWFESTEGQGSTFFLALPIGSE